MESGGVRRNVRVLDVRIYGLTGNMASGKSTVARLLASQGVPIIDADQVSRDVVAPGSDGLREVVARFPGVLGDDGALDRRALAARVFADAGERKALEGILHPLIGQETMRRFAKLDEEGKEFAVYEATLLVENKLHQAQDGLIVVTAPIDRMLARVRARDGLDEKAAMARISAQLPQEVKAKVADFVIHNDGDLNALAKQVAELLTKLRAGYTRNHG